MCKNPTTPFDPGIDIDWNAAKVTVIGKEDTKGDTFDPDPTNPSHPWAMDMDWDAEKVFFYSNGELEETLTFSDAYSEPDSPNKDLTRFFIEGGRFEVEIPEEGSRRKL